MLREHDRVDFKFSAAFPEVWHLCVCEAQIKSMQTHDEQNERWMNDKMNAATTSFYACMTTT